MKFESKLISRDDQVITYPDEPFAKKESALHKLSTSASVQADIQLNDFELLSCFMKLSYPDVLLPSGQLLVPYLILRSELMNSDIYYKDVQLFKNQYTVDKVSSLVLTRWGGWKADE